IGDGADLKILPLQIAADQIAYRRIVVDHEDMLHSYLREPVPISLSKRTALKEHRVPRFRSSQIRRRRIVRTSESEHKMHPRKCRNQPTVPLVVHFLASPVVMARAWMVLLICLIAAATFGEPGGGEPVT